MENWQKTKQGRYNSGDLWKTDDLVIYQSNPVAYSHEYIFTELKKMRALAVLYENKRENYLCKHNNIKYKGLGVEGFIDITKVKECKIVEDLSFWILKTLQKIQERLKNTL